MKQENVKYNNKKQTISSAFGVQFILIISKIIQKQIAYKAKW